MSGLGPVRDQCLHPWIKQSGAIKSTRSLRYFIISLLEDNFLTKSNGFVRLLRTGHIYEHERIVIKCSVDRTSFVKFSIPFSLL